jgi:hypothetical protein
VNNGSGDTGSNEFPQVLTIAPAFLEGKTTMNSSIRYVTGLRTAGRKVAMAISWASVMTVLAISAPLAARDNDQGGRDGRYVGQSQRDWRANNARNHRYRHVYRRPYVYAQPVYVPPPVYYEPRQSPGITLFFPLDIRQHDDPRRR